MTDFELSKRAMNKLDLAIAYLGSGEASSTKTEDIIDAKEATSQALAALVELTNRLNGNQPPKQDR